MAVYEYKIVNGVHIPLTPEEIAVLEAQEAERTLESALNAIAAKYDAKREALSRDMSRALLVDGATLDTNVQALRDRWAALADAENTEIEALFI